jgi:hypothetical protein
VLQRFFQNDGVHLVSGDGKSLQGWEGHIPKEPIEEKAVEQVPSQLDGLVSTFHPMMVLADIGSLILNPRGCRL